MKVEEIDWAKYLRDPKAKAAAKKWRLLLRQGIARSILHKQPELFAPVGYGLYRLKPDA